MASGTIHSTCIAMLVWMGLVSAASGAGDGQHGRGEEGVDR